MSVLAPLAPLRAHAGRRLTAGLDDATIERLATDHPTLRQAMRWTSSATHSRTLHQETS